MLTIYTAGTPNGIKVPIAAEELGLRYRLVHVNLGAGEQKRADFLKINPNGRIPALMDESNPSAPVRVFESGAILIHLAEKAGGLLPASGAARAETLSWLFLQVAGLGPAFGQAGHFLRASEQLPYAIRRFKDEASRHLALVDSRLAETEWLNGESYSIADIAHFGWLRNPGYAGQSFEDAPHVKRWVDAIAARPAVRRALDAVARL
jgi:GST-like protein